MNDYIMHIGTPHEGPIPHSGRFPYGSGEHAFQRHMDFYSTYNRYKNQGMSEADMAASFGFVDRYGNPDKKRLAAEYTMALRNIKAYQTMEIKRLHDDEGLGWTEIGKQLGLPDTTVISRYRSKNEILSRAEKAEEALKKVVDEYSYIDISAGANLSFNMSETAFEKVVSRLEAEGYEKHYIKIDQMGTDHKTEIQVLCKPGTDYAELNEHRYDIRGLDMFGSVIDTSGEFLKLGLDRAPAVDSSRLQIRYAEDGGVDKDGLIEIRRGLDDLSLGGANYAQVRINVDDTHYLKGMAIYSDDMPPGVDIIFNTNKHKGTPALGEDKDNSVLKPLKTNADGEVNWDQPFGATVKQLQYTDKDGNTVVSPIHICNEEGDWAAWSKSLSSQFLSKQPYAVAEQQLKLNVYDKKAEFDEIKQLTNSAVKQTMLEDFASKCDSMAVDLKGHAFPGQQSHVLIPFTSIPDGQCYATNYHTGDEVVLIRHPHEGIMQIPKLRVNNDIPECKAALGFARDAIGINKKAADQLSGADFDGDTAIVIPINDKNRVQVHKAIQELIDYDPKESYPKYEGMKRMTPREKGIEMGVISNLITDMTLKGAPMDEIVRATKYSMTVIDAEKHGLNYKQAAKDFKIDELKDKWQSNPDGTHGASSIISRAKSKVFADEQKEYRLSSKSIDPVTGEKKIDKTGNKDTKAKLRGSVTDENGNVTYVDRIQTDKATGQHYYVKQDPSSGAKTKVYFNDDQYTKPREVYANLDKKTGKYYYVTSDPSTGKSVRQYITDENSTGGIKTTMRQSKVKMLANTNDAYTITSGGSRENPGNVKEALYAEYSNSMKSLANQARLEWLNTKSTPYSKEAAVQYKDAVTSLNAKLKVAESKAPKERQAQLLANHTISLMKEAHPELKDDKEHLSKYKAQAINSARAKLGIKKEDYTISITDREWSAIQAGAVSHSKAKRIFSYADSDKVKQLATPRRETNITPAMKQLAQSLKDRGFEAADIADRLQISTSYVYDITS